MTRRLFPLTLLACLAAVATVAAQSNPGSAGPSRYLPRAGTGGAAAPAQGQPAQRQPAQTFGQKPTNQGPQVRTAQGPATQGAAGQQDVRQISGQQPIRPPTGAAGVAPAKPLVPQQPSWFPLDPAHEKWVNDILAFWEQQSSKVKIFECKFDRFDYDPIFGPKSEAKTISQGVIKYAQPDKGLYRVERLLSYSGPPKNPGEQSHYVEEDAAFGEHWVCDGKQIHAFEAPKKQVTVSLLPPELQGTAIVDGPLPFMFGAKAQTIKARYWIHGLEGGPEGKFLLEAVPKGRHDVQNFKTVHILLDGKTFLPESLILFAPNYDPQKNASKTTHIFKEIKTDKTLLDKVLPGVDPFRLFTSAFYNVKIPSGWKKVVDGGGPIPAAPALEAKGKPDGPKGRGFLPLPR